MTTAALLQGLLAAGPGRLKASKSALVSREITRIRKHRRDWIFKSSNPPEISSREELRSEGNDFGPSDANSVDQKQQSKSGTIEQADLGANPSSEEVRPAHGLQGKEEEKKDDGSESPIQETKTSPIWIRLKLSYYIRHFYSRQLLPVVQVPAAL